MQRKTIQRIPFMMVEIAVECERSFPIQMEDNNSWESDGASEVQEQEQVEVIVKGRRYLQIIDEQAMSVGSSGRIFKASLSSFSLNLPRRVTNKVGATIGKILCVKFCNLIFRLQCLSTLFAHS